MLERQKGKQEYNKKIATKIAIKILINIVIKIMINNKIGRAYKICLEHADIEICSKCNKYHEENSHK